MKSLNNLKRRTFLIGSTIAATSGLPSVALAKSEATAEFNYEVTRTEAEWRASLGEEEYKILREGETEFPFTTSYWNTNDPGAYTCKGCDLALYESKHYSPQEMGFVFFSHSQSNAVLTAIDVTDYNGMLPAPQEFLEVHCRRCGGHLGHLVKVGEDILHCINGTALDLQTV